MTSQAAEPEDAFGFATPIELAHRVASQLVEGGRAVHGWLGIAGIDLSARRAEALGIAGGALVREVALGGPAEAAGLQTGDVITELDGLPVRSMSALVVAMRDHQPGDAVLVGYWRDGRRHETSIPVSATP
jgi:S1-C subfamily serine protease